MTPALELFMQVAWPVVDSWERGALLFQLGQFQDDTECSRLRTLFAHYPPGHLLYERRGLHPHTQHLVQLLLASCIKDALVPGACTCVHYDGIMLSSY